MLAASSAAHAQTVDPHHTGWTSDSSGGWIERAQRAASDTHAIDPSGWTASRVLGAEASFGPGGLRLRTGGGAPVGLGLRELRRGAASRAVGLIEPRVRGNEAAFHHDGVIEWFLHGPLGIEHGFDIHERLSGSEPLELVVLFEGGEARAARSGIELSSAGGGSFYYGIPYAVDARGRALEVRLTGRGSRIVIEVEDRGATYPLHVDPLIWRMQAELTAPAPMAMDQLGLSISMQGDRLAAGAPRDASRSGSVFVFERSGVTWTAAAELSAPAGTAGNRLGWAVALDGDRIAVGAPREDTTAGADAGAVYVFERGSVGWVLAATLEPTDAAADGRFGTKLALLGDTIVVEACGGTSGTLYAFELDAAGWTQRARMVGSTGPRCDWGGALSLTADRVAWGAPRASSVFVFERPTWTETQRIPAPPYMTDFGQSVHMLGDRLAIGAIQGGRSPYIGGAVYVFEHTGTSWELEATLTGPFGGVSTEFFGMSLEMEGDSMVVGASQLRWADGRGTGAVFLFRRSASGSWDVDASFPMAPASPPHALGAQVALEGSTVAAATWAADMAGVDNSGVVQIYALLLEEGDACASGDECHSGFCVDGVCCDTACGGGASDCMACSAAAGGAMDGACGPVPASFDIVCRPEAGDCDVEERCDGVSTSCPPDGFVDSSVVCRGAVGVCDREERCSGSAAECPLDAFLGGESVCRASIAACDAEERCSGTSVDCPLDGLAGGETVCRAAAMPCDAVERCDGSSLECPADALSPDGASCSDGLACNGAEVCMDAMCVAGAALECDDGDACTADSCAEPDGCVHERFCCMRDVDCDDGDACTIDSCDGERCVHLPACDAGAGLDGGVADGGPTFATWNCGCRAAGEGGDPRAFALLVIVALALRRRSRVARGGGASRS